MDFTSQKEYDLVTGIKNNYAEIANLLAHALYWLC